MPTSVFSCSTILAGPESTLIKLGKTYEVVEWITHKYGCDPVVVCDDGKPRLMYRGLFHD